MEINFSMDCNWSVEFSMGLLWLLAINFNLLKTME